MQCITAELRSNKVLHAIRSSSASPKFRRNHHPLTFSHQIMVMWKKREDDLGDAFIKQFKPPSFFMKHSPFFSM